MMAQHAELLERHGIDYRDGMERFGGNEALFERLAARFLDDPHYDALMRAMAQGDLDEAYREAHSLKGVAGNLSFIELYRAAAATSDALRSRNLSAAQASLPTLTQAHQSVIDALQQIR